MTEQRGYASPAAFRRALTDRLKSNAAEGKWNLAQLQRQLAYDRFLERLYLFDDGWIVKGATALLARDLGMRATIDVDVYRENAAPVPPLARLTMPDLEQHGYRAYPLADHLAEKVVATFQRYGPQRLPSTRYKDLIDLVSIVQGAELEAEPTCLALVSEAERRKVELPARFMIPDRRLWEAGYAAEARRSFLPSATTLDDALAVVAPFLDPLMDRSAGGTWRPVEGMWESDSAG